MTYGSTASDIVDGTYTYDISSGTEQYYTIDVDNLTLGEILTAEAQMQSRLAMTADCREGLTAFTEKRSPSFTGK